MGGQEKSHQNSQVDGEEGSKKAKNTSRTLWIFTICVYSVPNCLGFLIIFFDLRGVHDGSGLVHSPVFLQRVSVSKLASSCW